MFISPALSSKPGRERLRREGGSPAKMGVLRYVGRSGEARRARACDGAGPAAARTRLVGRRAVQDGALVLNRPRGRAARLCLGAHAVQPRRHARFARGEDLPQGDQPGDGPAGRGGGATRGPRVAQPRLVSRFRSSLSARSHNPANFKSGTLDQLTPLMKAAPWVYWKPSCTGETSLKYC